HQRRQLSPYTTLFRSYRIAHPGVLRDGSVVEIDISISFENHIFENGAGLDGIVDVRFFFCREIYGFGIAAPFKIEDLVVSGPAVLVIADEFALRVGRQGGFTGPGKPEENGGIALFSHIG